jgi:hypothetical protein
MTKCELFLFLLLAGCDSAIDQPCTNIPAGGCPLAYGQSCSDPACAAVYACNPGNKWELKMTCPPREGGMPTDAGAEASPKDASIDAPPGAFGGPGCVDLQMPDCPLGVALICTSGCCGCEDLFVCQDGGWNAWGTCGPDGAVPK